MIKCIDLKWTHLARFKSLVFKIVLLVSLSESVLALDEHKVNRSLAAQGQTTTISWSSFNSASRVYCGTACAYLQRSAGRLTAPAACLLFALANLVFADAIDDATDSDIADLCSNSPANELYKIANKKQNSQQDRRNALMRMVEVSRECAGSSSQRLTQYHQKIITAGHKLLSESEVETRRAAIDCFQYVILQPANVQPSQGSINRGQSISNLALTDSDTHESQVLTNAIKYHDFVIHRIPD